MKKHVSALFLIACFATASGQMLQENFNNPFNPSTAGWNVQNLSASANPTLAWFQGNGTVFNAFNGGPDDYYAVNFGNTTDPNPATISSWLISPTVTLVNGAVLQFATRTTTNPSPFPDRLEVYMSTAGSGTNVGNTPTSLGTFSTLIGSINPSLTSTGYPGTWTVYSYTISGVPASTPGRIGFRYYVTNAGPSTNAVNSDYIGLDAVSFSIPCGITVPSFTTCAGVSTTLTAQGGDANTTYTWSPVTGNSSSVVVNPASTTVYTLAYSAGGSPCPNTTATVTIGNQLSIGVTASSNSVCIGNTVTLSASGSATTYSWSTGATGPVATATINATTNFSVGGLSGLCVGGTVITISALPLPTITAAASPSVGCPSSTMNVTAAGAQSYFWVLGSSSSGGNPITISTSSITSGGTFTLGVVGTASNGCSNGGVMTLSVAPSPTINATVSKPVICINESAVLTATGADTYVWSGAGSSSNNPYTFSAGTSTGVKQFTVEGTSSQSGCSSSATISLNVSACTGIENASGSSLENAVYPNPFTNVLNIKGFTGRIELYNSLGQMVFEVEGTEVETINTSDLAKGVYFLKAYRLSGEQERTIKLLKN